MTDNKEALGTSQDAQATTEPFPASPTPEQIAEWEAERAWKRSLHPTRLLLLGKRPTRKPLQNTTISWLKCCMR